MNWQNHYKEHLVSAEEAVRRSLFEGANVVIGSGAAHVDLYIEAMYAQRETMPHINLFHVLYFGKALYLLPEMKEKVHPMINFMDKQSRTAYKEGLLDFLPCHFHEVPALLKEGFYPVDVAVVQLSRPNAEGVCSLGVSCDYSRAAVDKAQVVVGILNKQMPFLGGDTAVPVERLDYIIEEDAPLVTVPGGAVGPVEAKIGEYCASLIGDGATLQLGIGAIPDAVLNNLHDRKDLGIHTEMFTDGVMKLMQKGIINGKAKTLLPGKVVSAFTFGSQELYKFLQGNEDVAMYPVDYTNDPYVIGENDNIVSINSCIEVDLTGQLTAESIGYSLFSGSGGQVDFLRGARRSKGGISIIAMPSTARGGELSRIVPVLKEGSVVTTGRNEVDYIVTEFGIARLRGKTVAERALALISIAHPDFREELEEAARRMFPYLRK